jgi:indolepyruvate decarboxylase
MPSSNVQQAHRIVHHTLGDGDFGHFQKMSDSVVCASAILTPENCVVEVERLIAASLNESQPVYIGIPADYAEMPVIGEAKALATASSDAKTLEIVVDLIADMLSKAKTGCILPGILLSRYDLQEATTALVNASGLPFATMFMDKAVLDESHPLYMGIYDGKLLNEDVRSFVESSECILGIGAVLTDFNAGSFTANIDRSTSINIMPHSTRIGNANYANVEMKDVLEGLVSKVSKHTDIKAPKAVGLGEPVGEASGEITVDYMYPRWEKMLKENDLLVAETGTSSMGLATAKMPKGARFYNQTLWGSIGWATPASFGIAMAQPERRTILITGEGSHQLTAQEVGQFARFGLKPIIFLLNNNGYLIERVLCKDPDIYYNDLAKWNYSELPKALGCNDWFTARVTTCGELDEAIKKAESCGTGAYIEVITDKYASSALANKLHDSIASLYS